MSAPTERAQAVIAWEDPPTRTLVTKVDRMAYWDAVAAELRARTGRWAWVWYGDDPLARTNAWRIRDGKAPRWRPVGSFEAELSHGPAGTRLYARYVGEVTP